MVTVRLGQDPSDDIPMDSGFPQGVLESPLIFTMIIDVVISSLEPSWRKKGYGFSMDQLRLTAVCYADDIVLAAPRGNDQRRGGGAERDRPRSRSGREPLDEHAALRWRDTLRRQRRDRMGRNAPRSLAQSSTSCAVRGQRCSIAWPKPTRHLRSRRRSSLVFGSPKLSESSCYRSLVLAAMELKHVDDDQSTA